MLYTTGSEIGWSIDVSGIHSVAVGRHQTPERKGPPDLFLLDNFEQVLFRNRSIYPNFPSVTAPSQIVCPRFLSNQADYDTGRREMLSLFLDTLFLHENVQTEGVSIQFGGYDAKGSHCHADFEAELGDFEQLCHHSPKVHLS